MKWLIGTPYRLFYTGKPPNIAGGPHRLLRFIRPFEVYGVKYSFHV